MIEVFYYPQCPWITPILMELKEIAKELDIEYKEINLLTVSAPLQKNSASR